MDAQRSHYDSEPRTDPRRTAPHQERAPGVVLPGRWPTPRLRARHGRVERATALAVVAISSVHLVRFVRMAARESLWNDELFSVLRFSGAGVGHTLTTYSSANNHVFFNLVNALTPGAGSVGPLHARWWSIVAVLAMQALALHEFFRRRWYLAGAGLFALFATSSYWLDLVLQARGYGFLGLAALVSCVAVWRYLDDPRRRFLAVLALATLLGTWTVPSYLLFGLPLWAALFVVVRRRDVVVGALGSAAAVAAVYAPIAGQVRAEMAGYEQEWGRQYTSLDDVATTLRVYLLRVDPLPGRVLDTVLPLVVGLLVVAVGLVLPAAAEVRRLTLVLMGATGAFFALNLYVGTSALRTTAFAVVPVAFVLMAVAGALLERVPPVALPAVTARRRLVRPAVLGVGLVLLVAATAVQGVREPARDLRLPVQDWQSVGAFVERTFPDGTGLACTHDQFDVLRGAYVDGRYPSDLRADPSPGLATGATVLIDSDIDRPPAYDFGRVASAYAEVRFPQRSGDYLRVLAAPPTTSHVAQVQLDGRTVPLGPLVDRNGATGPSSPSGAVTVRLVPTPGSGTRSVVLVNGGGPLPRVTTVRVVVDGRVELVAPAAVAGSGRTVTVALGDRPVQAVDVSFAPPSAGHRLDLREVWAYPDGRRG